MYNPKYNPKEIYQDLIDHDVDIENFEERLKKLSKGTIFNQPLFEVLYDTYRVNNYKL